MIDSHLHCHFTGNSKQQQLEELKTIMKNNQVSKAVLYLIDETDYEEKNYALDFGDSIIPSMMLNPKNALVDQQLEELQRYGIKMVKILPYEQQLFYEDYDLICEYAKKIQKHGMILTVCGSYGSRDIYRTNGVEMAAQILNAGFKNPLIVAHGGMVRQLDVFSLMCAYPNLFMDISFTIPYWWKSRVIGDLYFTMEKCDFERIFWGSDYPDCSYKSSINYFDMFCEKYKISLVNKEKILFKNFEKFYEEYLK